MITSLSKSVKKIEIHGTRIAKSTNTANCTMQQDQVHMSQLIYIIHSMSVLSYY